MSKLPKFIEDIIVHNKNIANREINVETIGNEIGKKYNHLIFSVFVLVEIDTSYFFRANF